MKKFYFLVLTIVAYFFLTAQGYSQIYTASLPGNWSDPSIWGGNGKPPLKCTNCTITINNNVNVNLDVNDTLSGTSVLYIGSTPTSVSYLIIEPSGATSLGSGHSIMLDATSNATIVLRGPSTIINGSAATSAAGGTYDGIFTYGPTVGLPPGNISSQKIVGMAPSYFLNGTPQLNASSFASLPGPLSIGANGTLPIVLTSFNAQYNNAVIDLTWATSVELNFSHFNLQRSGDGSTWASIATIAGKNAANGASYSYTDQTPLRGINYYRLQSIDLDGKASLSQIVQVQGSSSIGFRYGPNPANDHIGVTFGNNISSNVTVRLFNQNGQALQEKQLSNVAGTTYTLPLSNYPAGIYTLQVKSADGSENSTFRVLVSH